MSYDDVKAAVAQLLAQGVYPSKVHVREVLGGGSYETLWPLIQQARAELTGAPLPMTEEEAPPEADALYSWPVPDPGRVQALLAERRGEQAAEEVIAFAAGALAHPELMLEAMPAAQDWAMRHGWALHQYTPDRRGRDDVMRQLKSFVLAAGPRFDQIRGATTEEGDNGRPAA